MRPAVLIAIMAAVTIALRFLPFLVFHEKTPSYISYLGKVLPPAIIGMLVVYCLKDVSLASSPFGIPELAASVSVAGMQALKRNAVISILTGTAIYMLLIQLAF